MLILIITVLIVFEGGILKAEACTSEPDIGMCNIPTDSSDQSLYCRKIVNALTCVTDRYRSAECDTSVSNVWKVSYGKYLEHCFVDQTCKPMPDTSMCVLPTASASLEHSVYCRQIVGMYECIRERYSYDRRQCGHHDRYMWVGLYIELNCQPASAANSNLSKLWVTIVGVLVATMRSL